MFSREREALYSSLETLQRKSFCVLALKAVDSSNAPNPFLTQRRMRTGAPLGAVHSADSLWTLSEPQTLRTGCVMVVAELQAAWTWLSGWKTVR